VKNGKFILKPKNLARWKGKLIVLDANCLPNEKRAKHVKHSVCGCWIAVKDVYNIVHFKDHINKQCDKHP
jgi:hypothetical protein